MEYIHVQMLKQRYSLTGIFGVMVHFHVPKVYIIYCGLYPLGRTEKCHGGRSCIKSTFHVNGTAYHADDSTEVKVELYGYLSAQEMTIINECDGNTIKFNGRDSGDYATVIYMWIWFSCDGNGCNKSNNIMCDNGNNITIDCSYSEENILCPDGYKINYIEDEEFEYLLPDFSRY